MRHGGDGGDGAAEEQAKQGSQGKGKEGRGTKATDAGAVLLVLRRQRLATGFRLQACIIQRKKCLHIGKMNG